MAKAAKQTKKSKTKQGTDNESLIKWVLACRDEAEEAKRKRMLTNQDNFDAYHLKQDYSHKSEGQSREFLAKQAMSVEQISSFFQQALVDVGDWFQVDPKNKEDAETMPIRAHEIKTLLENQMEKADFYGHVGEGAMSGLLGALIITKVHGELVDKPIFKAEGKGKKAQLKKIENKVWQVRYDLVRQENFYPDPNKEGLYEIEDQWLDFHNVEALSKGDDAIYSAEAVSQLGKNLSETPESLHHKERETDQVRPSAGHRNRVKITEFWGKVLDPATGELLFDNVVITVANDKTILRGPTPNPLWHQESPFVVAGLLNSPHGVWPKALMDSPTQINRAINELFNLIMDGTMKAVNGISQIRTDALVDASQVSDGIQAGTALKVNSKLPIGAKVAEPVITTVVPPDALNTLNMLNQEYNSVALTSDARQGMASVKSQTATATVESSQTITSIFNGIAKNIEVHWVQEILRKSWMTLAQNIKDLDDAETKELLGEKNFEQIDSMTPQEVFAETVNGIKYNVLGITATLNKQKDFRKNMTLMQTISSSDVLVEAFTQKYDFNKLLGTIMTSLSIDTKAIERPEVEQQLNLAGEGEGAAQAEAGPDVASQQPQAQGITLETALNQTAQGGGQGTEFPPSRAGTGK